MQDLIRIGTRKSRLALVQTNIVRQKIEEAFPGIRVEICEMSTKGDELLDRTLTSFGGKGVFTQELEEALLVNGSIWQCTAPRICLWISRKGWESGQH